MRQGHAELQNKGIEEERVKVRVREGAMRGMNNKQKESCGTAQKNTDLIGVVHSEVE